MLLFLDENINKNTIKLLNHYIKVTGCLSIALDLANRWIGMVSFTVKLLIGNGKVYNYPS